MKIIKIPFKIIAAPFVVVLTLSVAIMKFLFCYAVAVMNIVSMLFVLMGVVTLFVDNKVNGCIILGLAFLVSPFGIPAIADWFIDMIDGINDSLRDFIMS